MKNKNNPHISKMANLADNVALALAKGGTDPNEVTSVVSVLTTGEKTDLFEYLDTVIANGHYVARSNQTLGYYRSIQEVCQSHLKPFTNKPDELVWILGWAARLMRYYRVEKRLAQPPSRESLLQSFQQSQPSTTDRQMGVIKNYNEQRGFGFIKPDSDGPDEFFHHSQLPRELAIPNPGQRVSYIIGKGKMGRSQAQQLRVVAEAN